MKISGIADSVTNPPYWVRMGQSHWDESVVVMSLSLLSMLAILRIAHLCFTMSVLQTHRSISLQKAHRLNGLIWIIFLNPIFIN